MSISTVTPQVRAEHDRPQRTRRILLGVPKTKLGVNLSIPGYHLYWCNDTENQIAEAQVGGYEFVAPKEIGEVREDSQGGWSEQRKTVRPLRLLAENQTGVA